MCCAVADGGFYFFKTVAHQGGLIDEVCLLRHPEPALGLIGLALNMGILPLRDFWSGAAKVAKFFVQVEYWLHIRKNLVIAFGLLIMSVVQDLIASTLMGAGNGTIFRPRGPGREGRGVIRWPQGRAVGGGGGGGGRRITPASCNPHTVEDVASKP